MTVGSIYVENKLHATKHQIIERVLFDGVLRLRRPACNVVNLGSAMGRHSGSSSVSGNPGLSFPELSSVSLGECRAGTSTSPCSYLRILICGRVIVEE